MMEENTCLECLYYRDEPNLMWDHRHICYSNPGRASVRMVRDDLEVLPLACRFKRDRRVPPNDRKPVGPIEGKQRQVSRTQELLIDLDMAFDDCAVDGKCHVTKLADHLDKHRSTVYERAKLHGGFDIDRGVITRKEHR